MTHVPSGPANWLCVGLPFCLAEMRREFQTGGKLFCTTLYMSLKKDPNMQYVKEIRDTRYLYFKSLPSSPMTSTSSASKRDCRVHQSGSSENTRNLMLLCLLRKCSIASWRVIICQVSTVLNHHRISLYANAA